MARSKFWRQIRKQWRAYRRARKAPDPGWQRAKPRVPRKPAQTLADRKGRKQAPTMKEELARIKAENDPNSKQRVRSYMANEPARVPRETIPVRVTSTGDYWNTDEIIHYRDGKVVSREPFLGDWAGVLYDGQVPGTQSQRALRGKYADMWIGSESYNALPPEQQAERARQAGFCGAPTQQNHPCMHRARPGGKCSAGHRPVQG